MPKTHIRRSIRIQKPAAEVFPFLSDLTQWPSWSPWLLVEPDAKLTYTADGSAYSWEGNLVGSGSITKEEEQNPQRLECTLSILKPWKSTSKVTFQLEDLEGGCEVEWIMDGSLPLPMFWMKPMIESMVGMDYQRGLLLLKDVAETGSSSSTHTVHEHETFQGLSYVGITRTCMMSKIGPQMAKDLETVHGWMKSPDLASNGPPFSIYHRWDCKNETCTYTTGVPVVTPPPVAPKGGTMGRIAPGACFVVEHRGPYHHLGNAWAVGMSYQRNKKFKAMKGRSPFEVYVSDPQTTPEDQLVTKLYFPRGK